MRLAVFVLVAGVVAPSFAADGFSTFAPGEVKVGGEIGRRMAITAEKLMRKTDIEQVFFRHFRNRKEKPDVWGGFTGWGMTLDAIVKAAAHGVCGDEMHAFKEKWVAETIASQTPDGAISFFGGKLGMWDNHEQAYLLQALCNDWEWSGNRKALDAARKLGDYLIARGSGVNLGLETGFVMLYRDTGDERYAKYLRDQFLIEKGNDEFDQIAVNGVAHVYTWIQRALAQIQYRKVTGRTSPDLEAAADELYRRTFSDYLSISGSMSGGPLWGEVWDKTQIGLGKWGETCVSAYLLRCTTEWMKDHPEPRYGDLFERVMYNAFLGAQSHDGSKQRYFIPFDEQGEWFQHETYCCPNNLRRMMFELPDAVFFRTADGFAVNLYTPAELKTSGLSVKMETAYPVDCKVRLSIVSDRAGKVKVRVPRWTGLPDAGTWREIAYAEGESAIDLEFPMEVRLVRGRQAKFGKVAVMRGPVVYALEAPAKLGWKGFVDVLEIDCSVPMKWTGKGIEVEFVENRQKCLRHRFTLTPFCSDGRARTYFPIFRGEGGKAGVDELITNI